MTSPFNEYVYEKNDEFDLCQGDVLRLDGDLGNIFFECFPKIDRPKPGQSRFAMVLNQSCDLARRKKSDGSSGECSSSHITICLVSPIDKVISYDLTRDDRANIQGYFYLDDSNYFDLLRRTQNLLNNSQSKSSFFLPKKEPISQSNLGLPYDSVSLLHLKFGLQAQHYEIIKGNRIASLTSEFRAKIGYMIADFYGRVATTDLYEAAGFTEDTLTEEARNILTNAGVAWVPDHECIQRIKKNAASISPLPVNDIIDNYRKDSLKKEFKPLIGEAKKRMREQLTSLFQSDEQLAHISGADVASRNRLFSDILKSIDEAAELVISQKLKC